MANDDTDNRHYVYVGVIFKSASEITVAPERVVGRYVVI